MSAEGQRSQQERPEQERPEQRSGGPGVPAAGQSTAPVSRVSSMYIVRAEPASDPVASDPAAPGATAQAAGTGDATPAATATVPLPTGTAASPAGEPPAGQPPAGRSAKRGNRGFGVLIAVLASVLYAVLLSFAVLIVFRIVTGVATMATLANPGYWVPVIVFVAAIVATVLVANRAGWWLYIIASVLVGGVVYIGSAYVVGLIELYAWDSDLTFSRVLESPVAITAGLLARELALWTGLVVGSRARRLTALTP
ncbi:MAG: hypothetical protein QM635_08255 [Microbacteriaceae bacterium]